MSLSMRQVQSYIWRHNDTLDCLKKIIYDIIERMLSNKGMVRYISHKGMGE